jgi:aldose sugar dehydrogenase
MERILNPPITRENSPLSPSLIVTARAAVPSVILYCSILMAILIFALIGAYTLSVMLADESNLSQHRQQNNHVPYVYAAYTRATPAAGGPTLKDPNLKVEKIFQGDLGITTSMAFLGPNDILVLEKNEGKVHRIKDGVLLPEPVLAVSNVGKEIEWGMLGIAVDKVNSDNTVARTTSNPNGSNTYVFLYYTEPTTVSNSLPPTSISNVDNSDDGEEENSDNNDGGGGDNNSGNQAGDEGGEQQGSQEMMANRLYRYELVNDKLVNPKLLLSLPANSPDAGTENNHDGGKVVVGPDHNVYIAIGDVGGHRGQAQNVQDGQPLDGTSGILRVTENGDPVNGSPNLAAFSAVDSSSSTSSLANYYYAYGIRNSFGIDFDPVTGNLWESENGADDNDEINLVLPGFNSGWSKVMGIASSSSKSSSSSASGFSLEDQLVTFDGNGKYRDPEFVSKQTIGPTALKFLGSDKLGTQYQNTIFMGDVNTGNLYNFKLNQDRTGLALTGPLTDKVADTYEELQPVIFGQGFGVITDIKDNPYDGYLYILGYDGSIYKISPL